MKNKSFYRMGYFALLFAIILFSLPTIIDYIISNLPITLQEPRLVGSLKFFLKEVPFILILLCTAVFVIGIVRSYVSREKSMKLLAAKSQIKGNVIASLFGIVTPFCSCGVVPMFLGLVQSGVPLGVSLSLLIAAPMINEIALIMLFGLFGWQTALLYVTTGLLIAITSGYIIGLLGLEKYVEDWVKSIEKINVQAVENKMTFSQRIEVAITEVKTTVSQIWLYIIIGIGVGSILYGYVPSTLMLEIMGKTKWWSVPAAVLVGIPLYMGSAGIIPIVQVLLSKGVALGTALAFMMSVIGLSLPEILILRRVLKLPLIITFIGIIAVGIIVVGYLFNFIY